MIWIYYLLLLAACLLGLILSIFTLPGLWLMLGASAFYAWGTGQRYIGRHTLLALLLMALASEIVEIAMASRATRKAGGSRRAAVGGIVGAVLGGVFLTFVPIPVVSTIVGVCLGSFLGAALFELIGGADASHSLRVGVGAATGKFMGLLSKISFGIAMLIVILLTGLPMHF